MKVAVLWSGGKESYLAYHKAMTQGYKITCLVTFVGNRPFLCHPLPLISLQAKALGVPHYRIKVKKPYKRGYREAISTLIETNRIKGIVTGDISFTDSIHGNWIEEVCEGLDLHVIKPLWGLDLGRILNEVVSQKCKAIFICVRKPWFDEGWLGRKLDRDSLKRLKALSDEYGINLCGEKGEYHTMVIDSPMFKETIQILEFSKEKEGDLLFMKISKRSPSFSLKEGDLLFMKISKLFHKA